MNGLYKLTDWIMKLAYINILWLFFSLLGIFIFGLFPATIAMFNVMRDLINKKEGYSVFSSFWNTYKKELVKGNIVGYVLTLIVIVLYLELVFIVSYNNNLLNLFFVPLLILTFIIYSAFLYVVPLYINYDNKIFQHLKNAFLVLLTNPFITLAMVIGCIVIYFINTTFPVIILFFSGSIISYIIVKFSSYAFQKIELNKVN